MDMDFEGKVRVSAHDDVMVTGVTISVLDESEQCLEQGNAELVMGVWWDYQTSNKGQIRVEAWDLAGNITREEFLPPSRPSPIPTARMGKGDVMFE